MELGKPSPVSISLAVVMVAVIGYLAWQATSKSNDQNYTRGAVHNESTTNISPIQNLYPLSIPGCGRFLTVDTSGRDTGDNKPKVKK